MSQTKENSSASVEEEAKSNKTIAVGSIPTEVKYKPRYSTIEEVKDAYVCGDIDISTLESKLEYILEYINDEPNH